MLPIADFSLGDALLTVLAVFFFVIWIWILITILTDLFSDRETSGWGKAAWVFLLVCIPFVTALVYLGLRGSGMRERTLERQSESRRELDASVRDAAGTSPADELHKLNELREKDAISDEEYEKLKAKVVG